MEKGWICPRCHRSNSPLVTACQCSLEKRDPIKDYGVCPTCGRILRKVEAHYCPGPIIGGGRW